MSISCIIPVFNEGKRILAVLDVICEIEEINEVLVINDGSTDETQSLLKDDKRIKLISYTKNRGKTNAVVLGIKASKNETIMTIDADLVGLNKENIKNLILPISSKKAEVSISLRGNSLSVYKKIGLDFVSGERVFDKRILGDLDSLVNKLEGFGLETFMDLIIVKNKLKIKVVYWQNVSHTRKQEKVGYWNGTYGDFMMIFHILKTANIFTILKLNIKMRKLRVLD